MKLKLLLMMFMFSLSACTARPQPLETVAFVDIDRFMGEWYVIAHIPTFMEDEAYNAIEAYALEADGSIVTTFTFREGGFNGPAKQMEPKGFVTDTSSNAVWGMQFVWPIKADYRIIYLDEDYSVTIVGRNKRDYVWLMARTPQISNRQYERALEVIANAGYDIDEIRKVPQQW